MGHAVDWVRFVVGIAHGKEHDALKFEDAFSRSTPLLPTFMSKQAQNSTTNNSVVH
jgi:hypothetical protein